ncbi:MAG: F0F1 ATP synthase subunit A [Firmicutes bacterium]|nr:F0F1 ATP synthase subunit A [Bacillota bacterium]
MSKKQKIRSALIFVGLIIVFLVGSILTANPHGSHGDIQETMRDAVLHETGQIRIFGDFTVNPGLVSAFVVTGMLFVLALIIRIFVIPKFTIVPGRFQLLLEQAVNLFDNMVKGNSPHRNKFLSAYVFAIGIYIFFGTMFELFGFQVITVQGTSLSLPAPMSDVNCAICLGCLSYLVIMSGGIAGNGVKGIIKTLKDFSLPISMSFRLFGALLSGALVTELVYHYSSLSYGVPVLVGLMFTVLHAIIQAYVLTMLTSLFYGEVSEPAHLAHE